MLNNRSRQYVGLLFITILLTFATATSAQDVDLCTSFGDDIDDGDELRGSIDDDIPFAIFCFEANEDDEVTLTVETTDGDLILNVVVANPSLEAVFEEYEADDEDDVVELEFSIPDDGDYLIIVSREGFEVGDTQGNFEITLRIREVKSADEASSDDNEAIEFPDELDEYDDDWQSAIDELEDAGIIASNSGNLVFNTNSAFFDGVGSFFTALARNSSVRDVIVAGELTLTPDSNDFESCSLMARIIYDSNASLVTTFLEVGIDNEGNVYWVDARDGDFESGFEELDLDLDEAHHILFIAQNESLTIYVNGELIFENEEIENRSGSFGIALIGNGADSRCDGSNIWAYQAPVLIPGLCEVSASGTVNRRSGPGTTFTTAGTLSAGERIEVVDAEEADDGFTWYELEDDSWVREDIVTLVGDCSDF